MNGTELDARNLLASLKDYDILDLGRNDGEGPAGKPGINSLRLITTEANQLHLDVTRHTQISQRLM